MDSYIRDMAIDGTYADHIAVEHLSQMLKVSIVVVREPQNLVIGDYGTKLHIGYIPDILHYVNIQPSGIPGTGNMAFYYIIWIYFIILLPIMVPSVNINTLHTRFFV